MERTARGGRRVTLLCAAGVAVAVSSVWAAGVPVAVSPGSDSEIALVEGRCPTFSWGVVAGAESYELVVYRVGDEGEEPRAVLERRIAGSASSWTPSLDGCLERGGQYAWSVRVSGSEGEGEWSELSWLEVAKAGAEPGVAVAGAEPERESAGGRRATPAGVGSRLTSEGGRAVGVSTAAASPTGSAEPEPKGHTIRADTVSLTLTHADTPSLRIHQTGASGDQEWGMAGNEVAFEIRDVTAATSPMVIEPGAPTHSLTVEAGGVVASGAGFRFPDGSVQTKAAGGAPAPVPETGQKTCWDAAGTVISCTGTGHDGELRRGVEWPIPRFMDNGDGTVTDNLTGLIWLLDASCADLAGTDAIGKGNWTTALSAAAALAAGTCGLTDGSMAGNWRLPHVLELMSLIDYEFATPAISNAAGTTKWTESDAFSGVRSSSYWSSTSLAGIPTHAWGIDLDQGGAFGNGKTSIFFVWPVRGEQ